MAGYGHIALHKHEIFRLIDNWLRAQDVLAVQQKIRTRSSQALQNT